MSGTTISGGSVSNNWAPAAGGATGLFTAFFSSNNYTTIGSGVSTVPGATALFTPNTAVTVSSAALTDQSSGGNSITTMSKGIVFAAPNDTITSAAATTLFGATGLTSFSISGAQSSINGSTGGITGISSGANTTLVGGTGNMIVTVTGAGSVAVAGPGPGTTGIDESASTGSELIATSPTGVNTGPLVAILGSGTDTVLDGGGASTIVGGSGTDIFGFIKSATGGSQVIFNFTTKDTFAFAGYTGDPVQSESVGSLGDVITLTDGTTITLVGIENKIFS